METILVIDDELVNPDNELRGEISDFGKKYEYKIIFVEAPDPEELRDKKKLKDKITRYKPAAVFLDIVHKGKQYNIAASLRKVIGHDIPILILTNYTPKDLDEENKRFDKISQELEDKANFIERNIENIRIKIQDNRLKREERVFLSNDLRSFESLREKIQDYKNGISDKGSLSGATQSFIQSHNNDEILVQSLKSLKVYLSASSMPDYFGRRYPTDFRQVIGYVLKDNFNNIQEQINNGIVTSTNPDSSAYSLDVSAPSIYMQDSEGNTIGVIKNNAMCEQLKKFADSPELCCQLPGEIDKTRKIVSDINNSIYEATKWRLRDVLKNAGTGKYKLDIGKFIINGTLVKEFEKAKQQPSVSAQLDKVLAVLHSVSEKLTGLEKRVRRLENRS